MVDVAFCKSRSSIVIAHIDSTTTTARGAMIGSCLPLMESMVSSFLFVTVFCSLYMDGVGLNEARRMISEPSLIPPSIPPE